MQGSQLWSTANPKPDPSASASAQVGPGAEPAPTRLGVSVLWGLTKSLGDHLDQRPGREFLHFPCL